MDQNLREKTTGDRQKDGKIWMLLDNNVGWKNKSRLLLAIKTEFFFFFISIKTRQVSLHCTYWLWLGVDIQVSFST